MSASNPYEAKPAVYDSVYDNKPQGETPVSTPEVPAPAQVPAGSVREILAWVEEDAERAQEALDAEIDGAGRASLIKPLKAILDA